MRYCVDHYKDPAFGTDRPWKLCANTKIGCSELASSRRGGKCYACLSHNLPCLHALMGCHRRVRCDSDLPPRKRPACSSREARHCYYDPSNRSVCSTDRCGNVVTVPNSICEVCSSGSTPCVNKCTRRAEIGLRGHCTPCSALGSGSASSLPITSVAPSNVRSNSFAGNESFPPPASTDHPLQIDATVETASATLPFGHAPHHSCRNFPVCTRKQKQQFLPLAACDGKRTFYG